MKKCYDLKSISSHVLIASVILIIAYIPAMSQAWQPQVVLVSVPNEDCEEANITAFDNFVHVVWEDYRDTYQEQVYYRGSSDFGASFRPGIRLSQLNETRASEPAAAAWEENVHIVWAEERSTHQDQVYYCRSTDGGFTFETPVKLTNIPPGISSPQIAVFQGNVHIIWRDDYNSTYPVVRYIRSEDNGNTWTPPQQLSATNRETSHLNIAVSGINVYISWCDSYNHPAPGEIFFTRSMDNGENWDPAHAVISNLYSFAPHEMLVFENNIHVLMEDRLSSAHSPQIYYARSTDLGGTWDANLCLNPDEEYYSRPQLAISGETIHATWTSDDGIQYRMATGNGDNWEPTIFISEISVGAKYPAMAAFDENVYVVWLQRNADGDDEVIFRRKVTDFSIDEGSLNGSAQLVLFPNYPNPFTESTTLSFYLPAPASVIIEIYSNAGILHERIVKELLSEGRHIIVWDAEDSDPGIYICCLKAYSEGKTYAPATRKMIVH